STLEGFPLGWWIATQRQRYTTGRLDATRQGELEAGPGWCWRRELGPPSSHLAPPKPDSWDQGRDALLTVYKRHSHAAVRADHVEDGFRLGAWVSRQRQMHRDGGLAGDRVQFLESLAGWSWHPKRDAWDVGLRVLLSFVEREGHAVVPRHH